MIRDPFYRQIIERLDTTLDPELFEECAADLLRAIYPSLVPIRGGSDSGMDGAIADGRGEPFPLVTTTEKNVILNLTCNLKSYLKDGGFRRKVVLATSRKLTQQRRKNLYTRASELGFVLIQIHDQAAIANLLYRSKQWCVELLNLTGDPPALSVMPRTERPLLNLSLISREADLSWLCENIGDRLLVGQPGSGKTFLLHKLAMKGKGVFVISKDLGKIAADIRTNQPKALIVDDAQVYDELIKDLKQIRGGIGGKFSIIASCWPGDQASVAEILNLPESRIRNLHLLTRDEIVEVIKATRLYGPNDLIREIVNQSAGRPGLAVTLAYLCLQGGIRQLASGDAISESILRFLKPDIRSRVRTILAAFSVGGDSGMLMDIVAKELELKVVEVREIVATLAAGGIISEVGQHCLSVQPAGLRHALVRDVFFKDATSLDIEPLLAMAPSRERAALALIGARSRGAAIPLHFLTGILEEVQSKGAWEAFACLGHDEASWLLKHHMAKIGIIARPALSNAPEIAIPLLLKAAIGDQRPLHSTTEHPLRLIQDWIQAAYPGTGQALKRREILFQSLRDWILSGGNIDVGLRAIHFVLSPEFQDLSTDPGSGMKVTIHHGSLLMNEMLTLHSLWPEVLDLTKKIEIRDWKPIRSIIEDWAYPGRSNPRISKEMNETMRSLAEQMLVDIIPLIKKHPGIRHWVKGIVDNLNLNIEITLDKEFEILYPKRDLEDLEAWKEVEKTHRAVVCKLASSWSKLNPIQVVKKIERIEGEANSGGIGWPRWTPFLCAVIAEKTMSPNAWIRAMVDADVTSDLVGPFFKKASKINEPGWIDLATTCLERSNLRGAVISVVLTLSYPPEDVLSKVLMNMEDAAEIVKTLYLRNEVPEDTLKKLLEHDDVLIASAAAWGEWHTEPEGIIRKSLRENWRKVIINRVNDDYLLTQAFKDKPKLAYDWLKRQLTEEDHIPINFKYENMVKSAVSVLDKEARRLILQIIPDKHWLDELVSCLVGENLDLYRELLTNRKLKRLHLVPLEENPEGVWIDKAKLALDAGYSIEEVADAVYANPMALSWEGNESEMWRNWVERFERLCSHEDERIRLIGKKGKTQAKNNQQRSLGRERREAIYGSR